MMDDVTLSGERLAAFLVSVSFAAGLNLYATVATLGLLGRFELVALPPGLGGLADPWVIGAAAALFVIEFIADKIPVFDLIWNALQTFIRIPAAALISYAATSQLAPHWQMAAAVAGAAMALVAHGGKTAARAAVTPSPEPFSNFALSAAEDIFTIFVTWFATRHPFIAAAIVLTATAVIVWLIRVVIRSLRALFRKPSPFTRTPPRTGPGPTGHVY
jgi:hypothetical protein